MNQGPAMKKPNVFIIGTSDIAQIISKAGFNPILSFDDVNKCIAVIVDTRNLKSDDDILKLTEDLETLKKKHHLIVFAYADENNTDYYTKSFIFEFFIFDGIFSDKTPPAIIKTRLEMAMRIRIMSQEAFLRFETLNQFGYKMQKGGHNKETIKVLMYGSPTPDSLYISTLLDEQNVESFAALSTFMAFDFIHKNDFDAVIILPNKDVSAAYGFCQALRRNTKLFHMPCVVLNYDDAHNDYAIDKGATFSAKLGQNDAMVVSRLMSLISEKRYREALEYKFEQAKNSHLCNKQTGLYVREFFEAHKKKLIKYLTSIKEPLALADIEINLIPFEDTSSLSHEIIKRIYDQAGSMLSKLIRTEDIASRTGPNRYSVLFPFSDTNSAIVAARRISAVLEHSSFDTGYIGLAANIYVDYNISSINDENEIEFKNVINN